MGRLFYTSPRASFLREICHFLYSESQKNTHDPLFLARYTLYLPNRRACLNAQKILLEIVQKYSSNQPLPLPRMYGLNDYEALAIDHSIVYDSKKIIDPFLKQHVIAKILVKIDENLSLDRALSLSKSMVKTMHTLVREEITIDHLLCGDDHPNSPFSMLKTVMKHYPTILQDWEVEEGDTLKKRIFNALPLFWKNNARGPVMIAGISQYQADSLALLSHALDLSHVDVVIPCVDEQLLYDDAAILESSPLFHSHKMMGALSQKAPPQALKTILDAFGDKCPLSDKYLLESHDFFDQANDIAACIESYRRKGISAITVVAPERRLAEHLAAILALRGIFVNDSSSIPLSQTLFGDFILSAGRVLTSHHMEDYLALLKHPWVSIVSKEDVYAYEVRLRLQPLMHKTLEYFENYFLRDTLAPLLFQKKGDKQDFLERLNALATLLAPRFFKDDEEHPVFQLFKELNASMVLNVSLQKIINGNDFMALLQGVLDHKTQTPCVPSTPDSVNIIGVMEARVSTSDLLIMTGLNEGVLPRLLPADIWISPYIQQRFFKEFDKNILPSTEEWIGLQAQDVWQSVSNAKKVILCHRHFDNGQPTISSRFLDDFEWSPYAFETEGGKENTEEDLHKNNFLQNNLLRQDEKSLYLPPTHKITRSVPCPRSAMRPTTLSISAIELLLKDPYGFYAKYILKLYPLFHWQDESRALIFGQYLHQAIDCYAKLGCTTARAPFVLDYFHQKKYLLSLMERVRLNGFCHWLENFDHHISVRSKDASKTEHALSMSHMINGTMIEIKGILDRIDEKYENNQRIFHVMDYKTGQVPSKKAITMGYAPQLPLCGLLVMSNYKESVTVEDTLRLSYLHVLGKSPFGEEYAVQKVTELIESARIGLQQCLVTYLRDDFCFYPSPNPWNKIGVNAYAHLARENAA